MPTMDAQLNIDRRSAVIQLAGRFDFSAYGNVCSMCRSPGR
jgi:hypothetical protein